jgi:glycosyltransferase involved in cell wall biosynthesis
MINKKKIKLTIAFVTYNRKKFIIKRVRNILKKKLPTNIEIIVLDDNSNDGTYKNLIKLTKNSKIKIFKNNSNYGFSKNYFEALKKSKGEFVLWASDKESFYLDGINYFLNWTYKKQIVDAVVLNFKRNFDTRGNMIKVIRKNNTRLIKPNEIWKCSHAPGILWRRKAILNEMKNYNFYKKRYPKFLYWNPHLILIIKLIAFKRSYFLNSEITYQAEYTKFSHFKNDNYWFLQTRWQQHKELIDLLKNCARIKKYKVIYHKILHFVNLDLYNFISTAIREERPDLYKYWWKGTYSPFEIIKRSYKTIIFIFKYFFYDCSWTLKRIKKRLKLIF